MRKRSAYAFLLNLFVVSLTLPSQGQIIAKFTGKAPPPYVASSGDHNNDDQQSYFN